MLLAVTTEFASLPLFLFSSFVISFRCFAPARVHLSSSSTSFDSLLCSSSSFPYFRLSSFLTSPLRMDRTIQSVADYKNKRISLLSFVPHLRFDLRRGPSWRAAAAHGSLLFPYPRKPASVFLTFTGTVYRHIYLFVLAYMRSRKTSCCETFYAERFLLIFFNNIFKSTPCPCAINRKYPCLWDRLHSIISQ